MIFVSSFLGNPDAPLAAGDIAECTTIDRHQCVGGKIYVKTLFM